MKNIPYCQLPEIHTVSDFIDEPFVEIKENSRIVVEMQYPLLKMKNAEKRCFIRKGASDRLNYASSLLPDKLRFKILDAWRPFALQKELYSTYKAKIISDFNLFSFTEKEKNDFIANYVSIPNDDRDIPPVHTTGGAIDLTIVDNNGNELQMGTEFDSFSPKTNTDYYENTNESTIIRDNRRLLYSIMIKAGFTNLPSEWWHYDFGDRFWAYYTKTPTLYRGIFNRSEINEK